MSEPNNCVGEYLPIKRMTRLVWSMGCRLDHPYTHSDCDFGRTMIDQQSPERVAERTTAVFYSHRPDRDRLKAELLRYFQSLKIMTN